MNTGQRMSTVRFNPTGTTLITAGSDGSTELWNVASHDRDGAPLTAPGAGSVTSLAISPAADSLATGNQDGDIQLWNPAMFQQASAPLTISTIHSSILGYQSVFSANREFLAAENGQGGIRLWNLITRRPAGPPIIEPDNEADFDVSPDGKTLAVAAGGAQLWNVSTGQKIGRPTGGSNADSVAFNPDGTLLAIGDQNGNFQLWDVATQRPARIAAASEFPDPFSPDGKIAATGAGPNEPNEIQLFNVTSGQRIGTPMTGSAELPPVTVTFSPDGARLATVVGSGTIRLWDVATQQEIGAPMSAGAAPVYSVAFSPDGTILATGDSDGTIRLWDVATQQEIGAPMSAGAAPIYRLAFSPDGTMLQADDGGGKARLWHVAFPRDLLTAACAIAGQSLTRQQWTDYVGTQPFQQVCPSA